MEKETLETLLLVTRLGTVTVTIWICSRIFDLWQSARLRAANRDAYIRAIYAEVEFNTFDMTRFLDSVVPLARLETLFLDPDFVPHITDARHTDVYKARIHDLHAVSGHGVGEDNLVAQLVRFYGELEKVTQQIEGLSKVSFRSISPVGKAGTISRIYRTCENCEDVGIKILTEMEIKYPNLKLSRALLQG